MRGQSAFEFTMLMALGMLMMIILIILGANLSQDSVAEQRRQAMLDLGYTIQDEFILATTVQPGYSRVITLPATVNNFAYDVTLQLTAIQLVSGEQQFIFRVPNATGSLVKGENIITYTGDALVVSQ